MPFVPSNDIARKMLEIPPGCECAYFRDDFDEGGPVVIAYVNVNASPEERAMKRAKVQEAVNYMCEGVNRRNQMRNAKN